MTYSYTTTKTQTFTLTHARELASRVVADLRLCNLYYNCPSLPSLDDYEVELVELLRNKYLATYEFGFKLNEKRVVSWYYKISPSGDVEGGSPGGVYARADVTDASFFNFATYSDVWRSLDDAAKERFRTTLPFRRADGTAPSDGQGYWSSNDRGYAAGGTLVTRGTFRPY